eukprot:3242270-Prymnesium_polylepis.1
MVHLDASAKYSRSAIASARARAAVEACRAVAAAAITEKLGYAELRGPLRCHDPTWPEGRTNLSPRVCVAALTQRPGDTRRLVPSHPWRHVDGARRLRP